MSNGTLPGCIGYFGKPISPNGPCQSCSYAEVCQRVVAKERLQIILAKVEEAQRVLRG